MNDTDGSHALDQSPINPGGGPARPRKSKVSFVVWGCVGLGVVGIVAVAVIVWLFIHWGMGMFEEQVKMDLRDNPVVIEHLGRLDSLEVMWSASMAAPGTDEFVFRAEGTKGTGVIRAVCVTRSADREEVVSGTLEMSDGSDYDLFPEGGPDDDGD
jgi:hypothetical protein